MAISTTKQRTSALNQLNDLEDAHKQAADRATELTREYTAKNRRLHGWMDEPGLLDLLRRLQHREPDRFAADGSPRGPEATMLQKEIDAVGDPQALVPEMTRQRASRPAGSRISKRSSRTT